MLQVKFSDEESSDCKTVVITDTTGDYNENTNPTGWGGINPATTDVTMAELVITKPDGSTVTIDMFALGFPVTSAITLTAEQAEYVNTWTDGQHTMVLTVGGTFGGDDFSSSYEVCPFLTCLSCCCVQKKWIAGRVGDGNHQKRADAQDLFDIMMANINCGDTEKATDTLAELDKLCSGCGCS